MKENLHKQYVYLTKEIEKHDHRTLWFAFGRSLLATGQLLSLLATRFISFLVPVGNYENAKCDGLRKISILCLNNPTDTLTAKRWILIGILTAVAIGIFPRIYRATPHMGHILNVSKFHST